MLRRNILCHRGFWNLPEEQNTAASFERAIEFGFGIETDIRDYKNQVVIAHNPFEPPVMLLEDFFSQFALHCTSRLALNVKSDGIGSYCKSLLNEFELNNLFFFDMSIPEHIQYLQNGLPTYSRISEFEPNPLITEDIQGLWVDSFVSEFDLGLLKDIPGLTKKTLCFVSPELHGRDPFSFWESIAELDKVMDFEICTDLPVALLDFLGES